MKFAAKAALITAILVDCAPVSASRATDEAESSFASAKTCDVKNYGAAGNGTTKDTAAIQAAIDDCAGGTVLLQGGIFLSGMIRLGSNQTLLIDPSATLLGSQDIADYPDTNPAITNSQLSNCRKALVYAEGVEHLAIKGGGRIDGHGGKPEWKAAGVPEKTRPMAVFIVLSNDVTIDGISIVNSAMWTLVTMETNNIVIRNVSIHSPDGPTRDGIDIVDGHHVLIEGATVYSEDDSICIKSGSAHGVEDLIVRNSHVLQSSVAQGLKLGTASTGHFTDLTFENITIDSVDKAAMAVESVDGAAIKNIKFDHIKFGNAGVAFFVILGKRGNPPSIGSIEGVTFSNIEGNQRKHQWGSSISGTLIDDQVHAPSHIAFDHVHVTSAGGLATVPPVPPEYDGRYPDPNLWGNLPASGMFIRHVRSIAFSDTLLTTEASDSRQTFVNIDATTSDVPTSNPR